MRFASDAGLWSTGPNPDPAPLTAVLEVSGAVLAWTVDRPDADVQVAFTDPARTDWLWRVAGERAHSEIVRTLEIGGAGPVEVDDVRLDSAALEPLRRLAYGHWLRRWWPASRRDGIAGLDSAVLDAELGLLTAAADEFFTDDTFDSDAAELVRPHLAVLDGLSRLGDTRVQELAAACAGLAEDLGVSAVPAPRVTQVAGRDDYALVAGVNGHRGTAEAVEAGVASVHWSAVPPGVFDAAEDTVGWRIDADSTGVTVAVRAELSGSASPAGIDVRFRAGGIRGTGVLDAAGAAALPLLADDGVPVTETGAWDRDWRDATVTIGADVGEDRAVRDRVRVFARARLQSPGADAFLAEVLAAESDY